MNKHKEDIKCPICENIKTIEVLDIFIDYNPHHCEHEVKEYIEYIHKLIKRNEELEKLIVTPVEDES